MTDASISDFDRTLSHDALEDRAARGASALIALGCGEDESVALVMRNDLTQLEIMRAAAKAGTILVALNWHGAADEVTAICDDSEAQTVIIHRDLIDTLRPALRGRRVIAVTPDAALRSTYSITDAAATAEPDFPEWDDLVAGHEPLTQPASMRPLRRYTSGSTGRPKGIRRISSGPRGDFTDALKRIGKEMMGFKPGSHFFTAAPVYHSAPSTLTSAALVSEGVSTSIAPKFEPHSFLATIEARRITHVYLVPTMMSRLLKLPQAEKDRYDTSSVEFCISTGSPWPHDLKQAMIDWWGPVFWETYGASEIGFMTMASSADALERPGTAGRMQMGGTVLILDSEGKELPRGAVGEIYARMDVFGDFDYSNDPDGRKKAEKHGHLSVGDLGWLDDDDYLFITDRKKDMIISGGANIFPAEIEAVLMRAPCVQDVAVFGAPDAEFGEQVVAAVQPVPGLPCDESVLRTFLDGKLARFKHPRIIDLHDALPREDSGKIFKARLREPYWKDAGRNV